MADDDFNLYDDLDTAPELVQTKADIAGSSYSASVPPSMNVTSSEAPSIPAGFAEIKSTIATPLRSEPPPATKSDNILYISGMAWWTTDRDIKEMCSPYGRVCTITFEAEKNGKSKGSAFVTFEEDNAAESAHRVWENDLSRCPHILGKPIISIVHTGGVINKPRRPPTDNPRGQAPRRGRGGGRGGHHHSAQNYEDAGADWNEEQYGGAQDDASEHQEGQHEQRERRDSRRPDRRDDSRRDDSRRDDSRREDSRRDDSRREDSRRDERFAADSRRGEPRRDDRHESRRDDRDSRGDDRPSDSRRDDRRSGRDSRNGETRRDDRRDDRRDGRDDRRNEQRRDDGRRDSRKRERENDNDPDMQPPDARSRSIL